jgi:hypothetical protein
MWIEEPGVVTAVLQRGWYFGQNSVTSSTIPNNGRSGIAASTSGGLRFDLASISSRSRETREWRYELKRVQCSSRLRTRLAAVKPLHACGEDTSTKVVLLNAVLDCKI